MCAHKKVLFWRALFPTPARVAAAHNSGMTTQDSSGNLHDTSGRFTEKQNTAAPDGLLTTSAPRRAAITLTAPADTDPSDVADIVNRLSFSAASSVYASLDDLKTDVKEGWLDADGHEQVLDEPAEFAINRRDRFIVLAYVNDEHTEADYADEINDVIPGANATAYEDMRALLAENEAGTVDDLGRPALDAQDFPASKCAVCGNAPDFVVAYGDPVESWNGACANHVSKLSTPEARLIPITE